MIRALALAGIVVLALTGCGGSSAADPANGFSTRELVFTLKDGRAIFCLKDGYGMSCDWENAE